MKSIVLLALTAVLVFSGCASLSYRYTPAHVETGTFQSSQMDLEIREVKFSRDLEDWYITGENMGFLVFDVTFKNKSDKAIAVPVEKIFQVIKDKEKNSPRMMVGGMFVRTQTSDPVIEISANDTADRLVAFAWNSTITPDALLIFGKELPFPKEYWVWK